MVDVDGSLELLQASGFELVFDESSPEPQASAAPMPTKDIPSEGSTEDRLSAGQGTSAAPAAADPSEVSCSSVASSSCLLAGQPVRKVAICY